MTVFQYALENSASMETAYVTVYQMLLKFIGYGYKQGVLCALPGQYYTLIRLETEDFVVKPEQSIRDWNDQRVEWYWLRGYSRMLELNNPYNVVQP